MPPAPIKVDKKYKGTRPETVIVSKEPIHKPWGLLAMELKEHLSLSLYLKKLF
jgi:hypothetical protein